MLLFSKMKNVKKYQGEFTGNKLIAVRLIANLHQHPSSGIVVNILTLYKSQMLVPIFWY